MKRALFCVVAALLLCFAGCGSDPVFSGKVLESIPEEEQTVYLIETSEQEQLVILADDDLPLLCWVDGADLQNLVVEPQTTKLAATCGRFKRSYTTPDGKKLPAYSAKQLEVKELKTDQTISFSDGAVAELWNGTRYRSYQLPDGTELLREDSPTDLTQLFIDGNEVFNSLSDQAKQTIQTFFEQQGAPYDLEEWVNSAYADYLHADVEAPFNSWSIGVERRPTAYSDRLVYISTRFYRPVVQEFYIEAYTESEQSTAFDRTTGEPVATAELFTCDEPTLKETIFSLSGVTNDETLLRELDAAFSFELINFYPSHLEVCFPQGSLPSQEHTYILSLEYAQRISDFLQPWAIPIADEKSK